MNTNSGMCVSSKPNVSTKQLYEEPERDEPDAPPKARNTSHTGTFVKNSDTTAPISARFS